MNRIVLGVVILLALSGHGTAASAVNNDTEARVIVVTEDGERSEVEIEAGGTREFCPSGCFVTYPNGDREALTGSETIEITGGAGRIR